MKRRVVSLAVCGLTAVIFSAAGAIRADAAQWVDCAVVTRAGADSFGNYVVSVANGCRANISAVRLQFDDGDLLQSGGIGADTRTVYSLSNFSTGVTFDVRYLKPGFYFPRVKLTATMKDYSSRWVRLPSFSISAPSQPVLTANAYPLPLTPSTGVQSGSSPLTSVLCESAKKSVADGKAGLNSVLAIYQKQLDDIDRMPGGTGVWGDSWKEQSRQLTVAAMNGARSRMQPLIDQAQAEADRYCR